MSEVEVLDFVVFEDRSGKPAFGVALAHPPIGVQERAVMFDEPFQCLPSQIKPVEGRIAALELGDNSLRLSIMIKTSIRPHEFVKYILARVAEWRVTKIMRERKRLGKIIVEAERAGEGAGNLADLERMGEPRAKVVALVRNKDLRLVGEPAEGRAMNDTVAVTLKFRARWRSWLRDQPATTQRRIRGIRRP